MSELLDQVTGITVATVEEGVPPTPPVDTTQVMGGMMMLAMVGMMAGIASEGGG